MTFRRWLVGLVLVSAVTPAFAQSPAPPGDKRVALVIGNGAYAASPLRTAVNDARAMARTLKGLGFLVIELENADLEAMQRAIFEFGGQLRSGGVGLFFFAGHGLQVAGRNYLVPIRANILSERNVKSHAIDVAGVLSEMEQAKNRLNLVILDASSENPFGRRDARGLAVMDAPSGSLIAYAMAPGAVAPDAAGSSGVYTAELIRAMSTPGLPVEEVFRRARQAVRLKTNGLQVPWETSALTGDFAFSGEAPKPPPAVAARPAQPAPPARAAVPAVDFGRYHALLIANQAYRSLPKLRTPIADVQQLGTVLRESYGFTSIRTLTDATRADMLRALDALLRDLTAGDNLLIYYAGHGHLDPDIDRGYWLPVDAEADSRVNWLSNADITDTVKALKAKHVLIVADSCYSGTLMRSASPQRLVAPDLERLAQKRARTVLTSGGLEPVADGGGRGHSVFARAFIGALEANEGAADLARLFPEIRRQVMLGRDQTPQYADIRQANHEGGDFIFVRR